MKSDEILERRENMLDFLMVSTRAVKNGLVEIYPKFIIKKSSDLPAIN